MPDKHLENVIGASRHKFGMNLDPMEAVLTPDTPTFPPNGCFWRLCAGVTCLKFRTNQRDLNAAVHRAAEETGIRLVSSSAVDEHYRSGGKRCASSEIAEMVKITCRYVTSLK